MDDLGKNNVAEVQVEKKRRKRRVIMLDVTEDVIKSLPKGVTYHEPSKSGKKSKI